MAENKQPFDDDFNADEFDAFDDEDFNFDDDDEASFQFDESDADTDAETNQDENSEYEFSGDEAYTEAEEPAQPKNSPMAILNNIIERLKNEEPKQLIKYGIGAGVALLLLIGGLVKLISPSPTPAKPATRPGAMMTASPSFGQNSGLSSMPQTNLNSAGTTTTITTPIPNQNDSQSLGNLTPTSAIPAPQQTSPLAQQQPTAVAQPQEQTVAPVESMQEMQQVESQNTDLTKRVSDLENAVNQLNTQLAADAQMNASNQAQIAGLIKSIDSMQTQMAKLNNAMQTMVNAVSQSSGNGQSGFVNPGMGGNNFNNNNMVSAPDYYVQAVIPGRAWLKNSSGQIITVAPGDAVPGYGTVTNIDSQNGVVTTSTGSKIVFGIDEG